MELIIHDFEILELVLEQRIGLALDHKPWKRIRSAAQLEVRLLNMVEIQVRIAAGPDKVARFEIALLRDHVGEQCVARNIEWQAKKCIARALV